MCTIDDTSPFDDPQLRNTHWQNADMSGVSITNANMSGLRISDVTLAGADIQNADLTDMRIKGSLTAGGGIVR